jgi:hypothetical protein
MIFDIVKGSYKSRAKNISVNELQNYYVELEDGEKAKNTKALIGCPGYRLVDTVTAIGHSRGLYNTNNDRMFTVVSNKLFEMDTNEVFTERGILGTIIGICVFADNGNEVLVVDGEFGYVYDLTTNILTKITDVDFPANPTHCIFTDGYFIVNKGDSGQFYFSASYDGSSWSALDFASAEYSSDNLQGIVKTSNGTIWMIGKYSTELWNNVGTPDLPWRRIQGAVKETGCIAPYSIATNGTQIFFLSTDAFAIYMGSGYDMQKISNPAIEYQIKQLTNIEQAVAHTYSDETHSFYVISFSSELTYVFDIATGQWHQRGTYNAGSGLNNRQQSQGYCYFNSTHYVGSYLNGKIFEMNLSTYDEDSLPIKRVIVTSHVNDEHKILKHRRFEIEFERGIGLVDDTTPPQIMLQFSNDGGFTWSSEAWVGASKSAGAIGEYQERAKWVRLGSSRDRVYRISMADPVKWIIVNGYLELGK